MFMHGIIMLVMGSPLGGGGAGGVVGGGNTLHLFDMI
jgi:hypothetical protein